MVTLFLETQSTEIALYGNVMQVKTFVTMLCVLVKTDDEDKEYNQWSIITQWIIT